MFCGKTVLVGAATLTGTIFKRLFKVNITGKVLKSGVNKTHSNVINYIKTGH